MYNFAPYLKPEPVKKYRNENKYLKYHNAAVGLDSSIIVLSRTS